MKADKTFSTIRFQEQLIERLHDIQATGVGDHKFRSQRGALRKATKTLLDRGYSEKEAEQIIRQAKEVWELERICLENEVDF
jgi:Holliday junction resolvasome RuvABC DNA-binding subunit